MAQKSAKNVEITLPKTISIDGDDDVDDDTLSGGLQEQQGFETAVVLLTLQAVIKPQQTSSNYPDNLGAKPYTTLKLVSLKYYQIS